jgi:hypothetical protein
MVNETDESVRAAIRLRIRQERAVPVLERFGKWLEEQKKDVLERLPDHSRDQLADLLPDRWSPPRPSAAPSSPE